MASASDVACLCKLLTGRQYLIIDRTVPVNYCYYSNIGLHLRMKCMRLNSNALLKYVHGLSNHCCYCYIVF